MTLRNKSIHRLLLSLILVSLFVSLVGTSALAEERTVSIYLWKAWQSENWSFIADWLQDVKKLYEEKYPDVTVEYQWGDFGADPLVLAAAGGTSPDASIASVVYARDLYDKGILRSLNEYWERSPVGELTIFPAAKVFSSANGVIFGAPWSMEARTILNNQDLFEKAGVNPDLEAINSWDEFMDTARKLHKETADGEVKVAGFHDGLNYASFTAWLHSDGGRFYSDDYKSVLIDSEKGKETIRFLGDLYRKNHFVLRTNPAGKMQDFHGGRIAMTTHELPGGVLVATAPFKVGQADFPAGPSGSHRSSVAWSNMYVIPSGAKHPDLGWKWIEVMLSAESQKDLAERTGFPWSPYLEAYNLKGISEALSTDNYSVENYARILTQAGPLPYRRVGEIRRLMGPIWQQIVNEETDPVIGLNELARQINATLGGEAEK